jgi:hypothetical protein
VAGNVTVTDINSGPSCDTIVANATGTVSITTTRDDGFIRVGTAAKANDPAGTVTIVNQTVAGSTTYFGNATTNVYTNG